MFEFMLFVFVCKRVWVMCFQVFVEVRGKASLILKHKDTKKGY